MMQIETVDDLQAVACGQIFVDQCGGSISVSRGGESED